VAGVDAATAYAATSIDPLRDDSEDYVASVFLMIEMEQQEGKQIELLEELTEDEMTSLDILISEMPQPLAPMLRYAINVMPRGLLEEEAIHLVMKYSVSPPLPPLPQYCAPAVVPPPSPGVQSYAPPHPNWPWAISDVVDLTQLPSDGEV
jgi:hypothetical protein